MKTAAASVLIILGCVGIMPNTHAEPSPSPKPQLGHTRAQGQSTALRPEFAPIHDIRARSHYAHTKQHDSDLYLGRNDGRVQQSTAGKPTGAGKPASHVKAFNGHPR
jgi:hypothetical protein